jgi:hypothetical protein
MTALYLHASGLLYFTQMGRLEPNDPRTKMVAKVQAKMAEMGYADIKE